MNATHTPKPWRIDPAGQETLQNVIMSEATGGTIAVVYGSDADAALLVNQAKAQATKGSYYSGAGEAEKPSTRVVTITPGLNAFAEDARIDKKVFATDLARVKALHTRDVHGDLVMNIPEL